MDIIIKPSCHFPIWHRVGSLVIPQKYNDLNRRNRLIHLEYGGVVERFYASDSTASLISRLHGITNYNNLPDVIKFDYNELEGAGMSAINISDLITLTYKLLALKHNCKEKIPLLSGFVQQPISSSFQKELIDAGFRGGGNSFGVLRDKIKYVKETKHWLLFPDTWSEGVVDQKIKTPVNRNSVDFELTFRQQQVLHLIKNRGLTNKQIAKELGVGEQAIKLHISVLLKKYGVQNRMQLALASDARLKI